jgi:hypothetical protein
MMQSDRTHVCAFSWLRAWAVSELGERARICVHQSPLLLKTRVCVLPSVYTFYFSLIPFLSLFSIAL